MKIFFSVAVGIFCSVFSQTLMASSHCPKDIKIGWEEYKPYQFEEGGKVTGSDMDVFEAVMTKVGCSYTAEKTPWERTLMNVKSGQMLFAAGASMTAVRKAFAHFSDPYDSDSIFPYVLKTKLKSMKLNSMKEMLAAKYKFVTTAGATYGDGFDALIKDKKLVKDQNFFEAANETMAAEMINAGRVDVFIASGEGLNFHEAIGHGPKAMFVNETRFMMSKKASNAKFLKAVNAAIADLHKDGSFKKIKDKYFKK